MSAFEIITPITSFVAGADAFNNFVNAADDPLVAGAMLAAAPEMEEALQVFVGMVGPQNANTYGFQLIYDHFKTVHGMEGKALAKLVTLSMRDLAKDVAKFASEAKEAYAAARAIMLDRVTINDEGKIIFPRPRKLVGQAEDVLVTATEHPVEDARTPGEMLVHPIATQLSRDDYLDALGLAKDPANSFVDATTLTRATSIFGNAAEIPARRILALKAWYLAVSDLLSEADYTADYGKAVRELKSQTPSLLAMVSKEEPDSDLQEHALWVLNDLLAKGPYLWIENYFTHLPEVFWQMDKTKSSVLISLLKQYGGVLFLHAAMRRRSPEDLLFFDGRVRFPLSVFHGDYSREVRIEAFDQWSYAMEEFVAGGTEQVHYKTMALATNEKDVDLLFDLLDDHVWKGKPLQITKVRAVIAAVLRREDLTDLQKEDFRTILTQDVEAPLEREMTGGFFRNLLPGLIGRLSRFRRR